MTKIKLKQTNSVVYFTVESLTYNSTSPLAIIEWGKFSGQISNDWGTND